MVSIKASNFKIAPLSRTTKRWMCFSSDPNIHNFTKEFEITAKAPKKMLKNRLALLVLLFTYYFYLGDFNVSAQQFRPGFVYTRNRGRCTPQYWSSRRESWPKMVPQTSTVSKIFGSRAYERYRYDLTLLEAAGRNDDGDNVFARLVKQSTAALLNSYARQNYPYSAWEVKTMLIQALVSEKSAYLLAQQLSQANEACN